MKSDQLNLYDKSYSKFTPDWLQNKLKVDEYLKKNSETILNFYKSYCEQFNFPEVDYTQLKVLDLGCGLGGVALFFAMKGAKVTGVDISNIAITCAKEIAIEKNLTIKYFQKDITEDVSKIDEFDLIIDSHLLHCLTTLEQRDQYWKFLKNNLKSNSGLFLLESMCYQKDLQVPVGYSFDEENTLWKQFENENAELPIRKILDTLEIEKEIQKQQFKIHYLFYHSELAFNVFTDYTNYPFKSLPRTIRVAMRNVVN